MTQAPLYAEKASVYLGALAVVATVVVRLTPSPKDDEKVSKVLGYLLKVMSWLPTFGVNPETKRLKESLEKLKGSK